MGSFDDDKLYIALTEAIQYGGAAIFDNSAIIAVNLLRDIMPDATGEFNTFRKLAENGHITALWQATGQAASERAYAFKHAYKYMTEQEYVNPEICNILLQTICKVLDASADGAGKKPDVEPSSVTEPAGITPGDMTHYREEAERIRRYQSMSHDDCRYLALTGDAVALRSMGIRFRDGRGVAANAKEAETMFTRAVARGDKESARQLALMRFERGQVQEAFESVAVLFAGGFVPALRTMGYILQEERAGNLRNTDWAVQLFQIGIQLGDPGCEHNLARTYLRGIGIEKDIPRALALYEHAFSMQFALSGANLAELYQAGQDVEESFETAFRYRQEVYALCPADRDVIMALAVHYFMGLGIEIDMDTAEPLFQKASDLGNTLASKTLAKLNAQK